MAVGTGAPTSLSVPFGALTPAAINGTWTLYVQEKTTGKLAGYTEMMFLPERPAVASQGTRRRPWHTTSALWRSANAC